MRVVLPDLFRRIPARRAALATEAGPFLVSDYRRTDVFWPWDMTAPPTPSVFKVRYLLSRVGIRTGHSKPSGASMATPVFPPTKKQWRPSLLTTGVNCSYQVIIREPRRWHALI